MAVVHKISSKLVFIRVRLDGVGHLSWVGGWSDPCYIVIINLDIIWSWKFSKKVIIKN